MTALPDTKQPAADVARAGESQRNDERYIDTSSVAELLDLLAEENLPFLMRRQVA